MSEHCEIDKEKFGAFLARLRKEKGLTQKELAERLFVSDKAVSKWERSLSLPDVALLLPLADCLGVSVTELLRGARTTQPQLPVEGVAALVGSALRMGGKELAERRTDRRRWRVACVLCGLFFGYCLPYYAGLAVSSSAIIGAVIGAVLYFFFSWLYYYKMCHLYDVVISPSESALNKPYEMAWFLHIYVGGTPKSDAAEPENKSDAA